MKWQYCYRSTIDHRIDIEFETLEELCEWCRKTYYQVSISGYDKTLIIDDCWSY